MNLIIRISECDEISHCTSTLWLASIVSPCHPLPKWASIKIGIKIFLLHYNLKCKKKHPNSMRIHST